ncbi:MAG: protein kinase [Candidatus Neomarinimicrobiota bacterium]
MIGKTISHFKILEKLGEGGMGDVYKAEDTNLDRIVALKFLPVEMTRDKDMKTRFIHEAKAASALDHTNICAIHEIAETEEGQLFISMGYYEGDTVEDRIKQGPLEVDDALDTTIQIAQGLDKAHKKKIIHRDIKSANIIVTTDGVVKIVDFGIAKLAGQTQVTKDGTSLGTASYMSPEQTLGKEVDHRTDIWSLGVVLYEMLTGLQPFQGDYEQAVVYSIMNEEPKPLTGLRTGIPLQLEQILDKALAKDPNERYQHLDELIVDLKHVKKKPEKEKTDAQPPPLSPEKKPLWKQPIPLVVGVFALIVIAGVLLNLIINKPEPEVVPVAPQISSKSIAVLPFTSIDRTEESEIFSEGIHDDILSQIAKIRDLKVIARTSVLRYRNTEKSIKEIAHELGVGTVLEGSVRRSGEKVRIVAQLIDADTEDHLWTETYDRNYADIFAIQSDVANKIAGALQATLTLEEKHAIDEIPTDNLEAYELYQQGKIIFNKGWALEYFESAMAMFEKAVELDPDFVMAYSWLSIAHLRVYWFFSQLPKEHLQGAKLALDQAKKLDPNHSSVHLAEGFYYYHGFRDYDNALEKFYLALKRYPNESDLLHAIGFVKRRQDKWGEALEYILRGTALDPQSSDKAMSAGETALFMRNWEVAEQFLTRATLSNPQNGWAYLYRVWLAIEGKGDLEEGRTIAEEALKNNDSKERLMIEMAASVEYVNRNYQKALEICNEYKHTNIIDDSWILFNKGRFALALNQRDLATSYFDSLKTLWVKGGQSTPGDWFYHFNLAAAFAGMGMKEKFSKEWELYETLLPFHKDFFWGTINRVYKIEMLLWLGEYDQAIDLADQMLSIPSFLTMNTLKLSPIFDPLRDNPRFQELIIKYSQKSRNRLSHVGYTEDGLIL